MPLLFPEVGFTWDSLWQPHPPPPPLGTTRPVGPRFTALNVEARTVVAAAFAAASGSSLCIKRLMLAQYLLTAKWEASLSFFRGIEHTGNVTRTMMLGDQVTVMLMTVSTNEYRLQDVLSKQLVYVFLLLYSSHSKFQFSNHIRHCPKILGPVFEHIVTIQ